MSERDGKKSKNESTNAGETASYKDDRMQELQAEIARLEERNDVIRNESAEYELKFQRALLRGVSQVPTEPIKLLKHPVAPERDDLHIASTSSSDTDVNESLSPVFTAENSLMRGKKEFSNITVAKNQKNHTNQTVCCSLIEKSQDLQNKIQPKQTIQKNISSNQNPQDERIRKLEIQMTRLTEDIEILKNQQFRKPCDAGIQQAINRGISNLKGRFQILNGVCVTPYHSTTSANNEDSSKNLCPTDSLTTSSSSSSSSSRIRMGNLKYDKDEKNKIAVKEEGKKGDKTGCGEFVLG